MKKNRIILKIKHKGSVLVITLLLVTLMSAAALSAAVNSYSIISNAGSYNDADVAKQAAMAGVADLTDRLKDSSYKSNPETMLINFDSGSPVTIPANKELSDVKKAPYVKYYSFTPQEKIKTISRCTKVAVVAAYDAVAAGYSYPGDIFTTLGDSMSKSDILKKNGFKAFQNPNAYINPKTGEPFTSDTVDYWTVLMGGPLDQGSLVYDPIFKTWKFDTSGISNPDHIKGLFSNPDYLQYDLIVLSLPDWGMLTLDDSTRENLENWIRLGGKMMIDSVYEGGGITFGIKNAPFSDGNNTVADNDRDLNFQWDMFEKKNNTNTQTTTENFWVMGGSNDQTWVMKNAYNGTASSIDWQKKPTPTITSAQQISGDYRVREITKNMSPVAVTYPPSGQMYEKENFVNPNIWIDKSFASNQVFLKYGNATEYAVGDRVQFMRIEHKEDASLYFPNAQYNSPQYFQNYWMYDTDVSGVIDGIDKTTNSIHFDSDRYMCSTPNVLVGGKYYQWRDKTPRADNLECTHSFIVNNLINDTTNYTVNGRGSNFYGFGISIMLLSDQEQDNYFTQRAVSVYSDPWSWPAYTPSNMLNDFDFAQGNMGSWDSANNHLNNLWATGKTDPVVPVIQPGKMWVPVSNSSSVNGYAVGSIVLIEPEDSLKEQLWGKVTDIDYTGKRLEIDLHSGPTPRTGHGLVTDQSGNLVLFGGYDTSNRFANSHFDYMAKYGSWSGNDGITTNISNQAQSDIWKYHVGTNTWEQIKTNTSLANRPMPRKDALARYSNSGKKLIVAGGTSGQGDDSAITQVARYADVWSFDMDSSSPTYLSWNKIKDRETVDQDSANPGGIKSLGEYYSEIYARPYFNTDWDSFNNPTWRYYVEPIDPATVDVTELILKTYTDTSEYPLGLTVGDIVYVYSKDDSTSSPLYKDVNLAKLTGMITGIEKTAPNTYKLKFSTPMSGAHTDDRMDRSYGIQVNKYCDQIVNQEPSIRVKQARCMSPEQIVMYYGAETDPAKSSDMDYEDQVYWGKVNITRDVMGGQEKSFKQLYRGPFFMYNPGGYYDDVNDQLVIFGGYNYMQGQQPVWKLDHALGVAGTPTWHFVQPTGITGKDYKLYQDNGRTSNGTSVFDTSGVTNASADGSIVDGQIQSVRVKHGGANNIQIGSRYYVVPKNPLITTGKLWSVVKSITKVGTDTNINFTGPLTTAGIKASDNPGDIPANDGLSLVLDWEYDLFSPKTSYDLTAGQISLFSITDSPKQFTTSDYDQVVGLYIGKKVTLQTEDGSNVPENRILSATIDDLDYAGGVYTVIFRYMSGFGQWDDWGNMVTANGSDIYRITSDSNNVRVWKGSVSGNKITWRYVNTDSQARRPAYRRSGVLFWDGSNNKLGMWGGGSQYNFLWKISPDTSKYNTNYVAWDDPIMNKSDDDIGTQRPFGLDGSRPSVIANGDGTNGLAFFSGSYDYAYERQDRYYDTLTSGSIIQDTTDPDQVAAISMTLWSNTVYNGIPPNGKWDEMSTDGSAIQFEHTLFSSLYDRFPNISGNKIFKLDSDLLQDILRLGQGGFAMTDLGAKYDVLSTYPCNTWGNTDVNGKIMVPYNEDNSKIELRNDVKIATYKHQVCKLVNMAMADVGDNGGFLFLSSRSLYYNVALSDQISKLDIMSYAINDVSSTPDQIDYSWSKYNDSSHQSDLISHWNVWLNKLAHNTKPYYSSLPSFQSDNGDDTISITDSGSAFYKLWENEYHYYRWQDSDGTFYYYTKPSSPNGQWQQIKSPVPAESDRIVMYKVPEDLAKIDLYSYHPGTFDSMRNAVFYINMIAYSQALDKVKVTGYYGGVTRAFLVSYKPNGSIISIEEVPAEE